MVALALPVKTYRQSRHLIAADPGGVRHRRFMVAPGRRLHSMDLALMLGGLSRAYILGGHRLAAHVASGGLSSPSAWATLPLSTGTVRPTAQL